MMYQIKYNQSALVRDTPWKRWEISSEEEEYEEFIGAPNPQVHRHVMGKMLRWKRI